MIERLRVRIAGDNIYRLTVGMIVNPGLAPVRIGFLGNPLAESVIVTGPWIVMAIDFPTETVILERGHERPGWLRRLWRLLRNTVLR